MLAPDARQAASCAGTSAWTAAVQWLGAPLAYGHGFVIIAAMKVLGRSVGILAFGLVAGLLAGCSTGDTAAKPAVAAKAKSVKDAPKKAEADKTVTDKTAPDKVEADKADADKEGCIYVDSEKGHDELECPHPPKPGTEAAEPDAPPNGDGHFGAKFALADAVPLSTALTAVVADKPVLISGEVEAVCQKKGCWMVIKDGAQSARVLMKDHAFAVPMVCRGKKVQIEGTLASRTFTEAQVKHLAKDGGKDPAEVSGERTEHVLTATGINIQS
ncbi:MAG: DUF4920 domain-containing protein [Nannocystaceae bacterium]|nr:DUF4920 domain-containing protein [Nannocystaceae bacterium]